MTRKELVCVLRDYAQMTEEPPTGRVIDGQEEIMRRAADMIENSVEIDTVLKIIDKEQKDQQLKRSNVFQLIAALDALENLADRVKELRG